MVGYQYEVNYADGFTEDDWLLYVNGEGRDKFEDDDEN